MNTAEVGGAAVMNLVGDPSGDGVTGRYFNVPVEEGPRPQAHDETLAHERWERRLSSWEWPTSHSSFPHARPRRQAMRHTSRIARREFAGS